MTKEQQLEEYIDHLYGDIEEHNKPLYAPDIHQSKKDFLTGYEAATPKWISVDEQLPDTNRRVLVLLEDTRLPQLSSYRIGAYINENWYLDGGIAYHEIVKQWFDFPDVEI